MIDNGQFPPLEERRRLMAEMNTISSMQWLIKDCTSVRDAYRDMQRAYDSRAAKVAMIPPPLPPPIVGPAIGTGEVSK